MQYKVFSIIPLGKHFEITCGNCYNYLALDQLDDIGLDSYHKSIKNIKTPLWTFSLTFVFIILLILGSVFVVYNKTRKENSIKAPIVGDIYEVKEAKGQYMLYKVVGISEDGVYVTINDYTVDKVKGIDVLFDKSYAKDTIGVSTSSLLKLIEEGRLFEIYREK